MLIYKTGDLMVAPEPIIVHGCNAQGVMGSGVAKAVKSTYPGAYKMYRDAYETSGLELGQVIWNWVFYPNDDSPTRLVANAITQEFYGRDNKRYVDYEAIKTAFGEIALVARDVFPDDPKCVAIPKIGAGFGGGDWNTIAGIIETSMKDFTVAVYDLA